MRKVVCFLTVTTVCGSKYATVYDNALKPNVVTQPTSNDTNVSAIWVNNQNIINLSSKVFVID